MELLDIQWWLFKPGIGLTAINDGLVLDCSIDWVVRQAIPQHSKLDSILRSIYEVNGRENCTWCRNREHSLTVYITYMTFRRNKRPS